MWSDACRRAGESCKTLHCEQLAGGRRKAQPLCGLLCGLLGARLDEPAFQRSPCWTLSPGLDTFRSSVPPPLPTDSHGDPDPSHRSARGARLHPVRAGRSRARRADPSRGHSRRPARPGVRGVERLPGAQDRAHGLRVDSHRGALGRLLPHAGPLHHPREQHRPDHRLGRRVDRGGDRVHPAGHPADGLRPQHRQGGDRGGGGRGDGDPADDPAPPSPDRQGARPAHLSGGHGLRGGPGRGREGRAPGAAAVPGLRPRVQPTSS